MFQLHIFDIYKFYQTIVKILKFFTDGNVNQVNPNLFHINDEKNENYFWSAHTLAQSNESLKIVKIGIEKNDNITFEIIFQMKQFQNFFICLRKTILFCLCLQESYILFVEFLVEEKIDVLKKLQNDEKFVNTYVQNYLRKMNSFSSAKSYIFLLDYYFEIIVILHKPSLLMLFQAIKYFNK